MQFIKETTRTDGRYYFTVRLPVNQKGKPVVGKNGDRFYVYADEKKGVYVLKLVGAMPDPIMMMPRDVE